VLEMFKGEDGNRIDTVVLACTHFPLLGDELRAAYPEVTFVDGGPGIARRIAFLTKGQQWPATPQPGLFVFTGPAARRPLNSVLQELGIGQTVSL